MDSVKACIDAAIDLCHSALYIVRSSRHPHRCRPRAQQSRDDWPGSALSAARLTRSGARRAAPARTLPRAPHAKAGASRRAICHA